MPVKRMIESMPNQWLANTADRRLDQMDNKCHSLETIANNEEKKSCDEKDSYNGYKSALNESVVDDLVSTLTSKLCLKTNHRLCRMSRLSPYQISNSSAYRSQSNSGCYCLNCKYLMGNSGNGVSKGGGCGGGALKRSSSMSDTYELMQQLLKEGSLIKEAVKRLQLDGRQEAPVDHKKSNQLYDDCSDEDFDQNENQFNLLNST